MKALVWLRTDLRSTWNSALSYATQHHEEVVAVFCLSLKQWQQFNYSARKIDLMLNKIQSLKTELTEYNIELVLLNTDTYEACEREIIHFCKDNAIGAVYFNSEYEWDERIRDKAVKEALQSQDIQVGQFHDTCLVKPSILLNKQALPYKVFTPYFKSWLAHLLENPPINLPIKALVSLQKSIVTHEVKLEDSYQGADLSDWSCSKDDINYLLGEFVRSRVQDYDKLRDIPSVEGTSKLSAYLSIGAVAPGQCMAALFQEHLETVQEPQYGAHVWLKELAWRDFYRYVMFNFTHVSRHLPFQKHYQHFRWSDNKQHFEAWKAGKTGYPIVDAAMLCLRETGWMHNRLRMIVASFYCKHLLLSWRWAEDYFMSQLIDGDFASNNGGWQWSASVGTDAAPYFRIFNPTNQSLRFDPEGKFIRQWLPELAALTNKQIHEPSKHVDVIELGYMEPIVDHKAAVARTKTQFKQFLEAFRSQ